MIESIRQIPTVAIRLPAYADHARQMREQVLVEAHEGSAEIQCYPMLICVPGVFWSDCEALVRQLAPAGWTMGRLLGYLAVQGVIRLLDACEGG